MITLNIYSEYTENHAVGSIRDNVSNYPINDKAAILMYFKKCKPIGSLCGGATDVLSGESIKGEWLVYSDGVYRWTSDIVYYFDRYNLKLRDDFLEHVLSRARH